ncbi:TetR/AcrR family transcriptional regulator [[Actinomadura] parvosata]|uniref:TetR/AcrR family transcriptional regulator n=1 Tax=[Actinomadura] parvosata TaxID=1955412 RepID=UPI0022A837BD|nr:TetR/AcrR family transcriptional regulator [Nonomuraea sp. ATCC 55076]
MDLGVELVTSRGASQVGLREIARAAGVSHGAPRRYFPTHHALLSAIAHRGFADLRSRFAAATREADSPRGQLHALARAYVRYAQECRGMFELMFRHDLLDSTGQAAGDAPRLRESTLPLFEHIVGLVGQVRAEDPAVTAAALWANVHGIAQLWTWGSLPLALTTAPPDDDDGRGGGRLDRLLSAALNAHLGPVPS